MHLEHDGGKCLLADSKRDILDDNGSRDELIGVGAGGANIGGRRVGAWVINTKIAAGEVGAVEASTISLEIRGHWGHAGVIGPSLRRISKNFIQGTQVWY